MDCSKNDGICHNNTEISDDSASDSLDKRSPNYGSGQHSHLRILSGLQQLKILFTVNSFTAKI